MPRHKHEPSDRQRQTYSGLLYECTICWRLIIWVQPKGKPGYWRSY